MSSSIGALATPDRRNSSKIFYTAWKSTQTASITIQVTVEAMIRTGEEYRESIHDGGEVYINEKVVQKAGTSVTGDGEFLGTMAAAINNQST